MRSWESQAGWGGMCLAASRVPLAAPGQVGIPVPPLPHRRQKDAQKGELKPSLLVSCP